MAIPSIDLSDARTVVTGAGSGIGAATARAFAAAGSRVLAVDIDGEAAEKVVADLAAGGAAYACDVSDFAAVTDLAARIQDEHGTPDIVVNNAGVGMTGRFLDTTIDDWRWIRGVNLDGVMHGCYAFGPAMVERGRGHMVNVSSGLGYTPHATEPHYVTTKAGVLAFSQSLRADWGRRGVGVSVICPGVINTPIIDRTRFKGERANSRSVDRAKRAFRRGHPPEKVAAAIVAAVRHNRALVPVGIESRAGWVLHRLAPLPLQQLIARIDRI